MARDSNEQHNISIDKMVAEDWHQKLFDYLSTELNITALDTQIQDIRDIILPRQYPYNLHAPVRRGDDINDPEIEISTKC